MLGGAVEVRGGPYLGISEHWEGAMFVFSVAMLYAFADWVDDAGVERACFLEGALLTIRGLSVIHETALPWFEKLSETSAAPSGFPTHAWCGAIPC